MPKKVLLPVALTVIILTALATLYFNNSGQKSIPKSEIDTAINQAKLLYRERKAIGEDFSNGPCLSNALMPNWVVDIAHNPRIPVDDQPGNQCSADIQGSAKHFVELDPEGNLIKAR